VGGIAIACGILISRPPRRMGTAPAAAGAVE
jgi:hypothetical protein